MKFSSYLVRYSLIQNRRYISHSSNLRSSDPKSILYGSNNSEKIESPVDLAEESTLPNTQHELPKKLRQPKIKLPFLSANKIENDSSFRMADWKQSIGQWVIKSFDIDMDRSRAGPVAGSFYFGECKRQGLYYPNEPLSNTARFYYETLNLPQTFSQSFQITALHYWLLSVRMRALPFKYGKNYQQKLIDRIFKDMELRMAEELKITSNRAIEGFLKDFHKQLLGAVLSYDEALMTDDITLASALWRNVFNGDQDVHMRQIEALLDYVRSQLYVLSKISDREFGFGKFKFVPPDEVVKPLTKTQEQRLREKVKKEFASKTLPSQRSVLSLDE